MVYCIIICNFVISHLCLTSHLRSTVILLDTGTPGTSREDIARMLDIMTKLIYNIPRA